MEIKREKHIGRLIYSARMIKKMTADEVGRRCNISRSRIYQWEKQRYVLPKNFVILSAVLGVPVKTLERENGLKPRRKRRAKRRALYKTRQPAPIFDDRH